MKYFLYSLLCLALGGSITGCSGLAYYGQAIGGHLDIIQRREPVKSLLADADTPAGLRERLQQAQAIRAFASRSLDLPDNGSYRSYADLERRYVVWNVIATPPLSLTPRQWCFPFAGCLDYRGYYSEGDALEFARQLAVEGDDIYVAGATAYSTLGWFDDPLLNTMLYRDEARLAQVVFHELAHQQLFIKGDTAFNEAFAETVGIAGTRRWLETHASTAEQTAYESRLQKQKQLLEIIFASRRQLAAIYNSPISDAEKHRRKRAVLASLTRRYWTRRGTDWHRFGGYDHWFTDGLNNAKLAAVATYRDLVPDFMRLLESVDHDFRRFYERVAALADCTPAERRQWLANTGPVSGCPGGGEALANRRANR